MSPRKTRRGAKADGANETLSETISKKSKENSPPPSVRTMKTRRQLSKTISQDSEADQSLEINKSRRKTVQESRSVKSTRSRKKALAENIIDDSSSFLDVTTSTKKRTRRAKDKEISSEQMIHLDGSTVDESLREKKSRPARSRKRIAKKEDSKSDDESTVVTSSKSNNSVVAKNSSINENAHDNMTINETEVQLSREDAEVEHASVRISRFRASASTPASPRSVVKRRGRDARAKIENFTPESSPITVNLSPHRTTKTPRKSPMNLGSPKSHADQSHGLTRTPRKLPVVEESPTPSEKSFNDTPEKSTNHLSVSVTNLPEAINVRMKKRTPKKKSPIKTPGKSPAKNLFVRKFSKSPKIVLRAPKVKSSNIKSPRVVTSKANTSPIPRRFTKSPIKSVQSQSPAETRQSTNVDEIISPTGTRRANRSQSPKKSLTVLNNVKTADSRVSLHLSRIDSPSNETSPRTLRNTSPDKQTKISSVEKSPTVVLNKISTPDVVTPETTTRSSLRKSNASIDDTLTITPVKTSSDKKRASRGGESPRRSKSAEAKRATILDSGTPMRPTASPRANSAKYSIGKSIVISSSKITPLVGRLTRRKIGENAPMLSSTPRERIRRSLNLSPELFSSPTIANSPVNAPTAVGSTLITELRATRSSSRIEDVTNPLISEDDESFSLKEASPIAEDSPLDETFEIVKKNITFEKEEEEEEMIDKEVDGTYELLEPVTPVLRRKASKRSLAETETSVGDERMTKRTCRVTFAASPPPSIKETVGRGAVRSRSATPGQRVGEKHFTAGSDNVTIGRTAKNSRKRSNSMTSIAVTKTPLSNMKRRSNSASDANAISASKTAQNASVNRLSKPRLSIIQSNKKTELKTPVARKAPNFAQIHERKFAKMESLVDAKKRVEKRHLAISSQIPTSLSKVNTAARSKPKVSAKPPAPSVAVNGAYNRYGFKLRKNDAVKMVTQKQPAHTSEKKQNENRQLLKGVRTNRRFELIMKARNIAH